MYWDPTVHLNPLPREVGEAVLIGREEWRWVNDKSSPNFLVSPD